MRHWPERRKKTARIEIIPMIDVMMFLLVFFVLISTNVLPALGLKVALPKSADPDHLTDPKRVTITIGRDGDIFLDDHATAAADLTPRLRALGADGSRLAVIIASDRDAHMQALIGVMDALKAAHVTAASIIAKKQ